MSEKRFEVIPSYANEEEQIGLINNIVFIYDGIGKEPIRIVVGSNPKDLELVLSQKDKDFIYYREYGRHYNVLNVINQSKYEIPNKETCKTVCSLLNSLSEENGLLRQQQQRLYNYFMDYLEDEMSGNAFSEMWDIVKEDESWNDE